MDTIIWAVPALKILARLHAFQTLRPLYLKNIMFSGEVMPPKTLQYWMQAVPQARFVNLYGPTEITCNCTYHIVQSADEVLKSELNRERFGELAQEMPNYAQYPNEKLETYI